MQTQPNVTKTPTVAAAAEGGEEQDEGFTPLDAEAAREWRSRQPPISIARVVAVQAAAGAVAVAAVGLLTRGDGPACRSAAWGVTAAWVPAAFFARILARRLRMRPEIGSALAVLMAGEGIKVAMTIALLVAAPRVMAEVNWLALLAGFVVTIKAAWVAWWSMWARRRPARGDETWDRDDR